MIIKVTPKSLGRAQISVLNQAIQERWAVVEPATSESAAALKLHDKGILDRHPNNCYMYDLSFDGCIWALRYCDQIAAQIEKHRGAE